ncbi:type III-B CRISPR module RAMP protein Cmr6 [Trichocoleus sp. FACHB-591]|uniref:RAMP superfamily CRISPR-associated protein n=1 Tax=Trichocoleus sp. FACHB-591 TaxID=2692872 RepID=UPI0016892D35|nr:RAMP superfamily CRISPR-associated protein [Trichocoleus sp. FACHB-591]MBD2097720.1 type III-B CRISPR module RAMP protein Cmr6 [Trichocoleus sp. FACHB-591]
MVFERPKRPGQENPVPPASQRPKPPVPRTSGGSISRDPDQRSRSGGRGGSNGGNGDNGDAADNEPSPWLEHPLDRSPNPAAEASFIEYLRWMRSPGSPYKDPTKLQIMQMAEESTYRDRLNHLTQRTRLIAGENNFFQVACPWRIRVGGHRGPESILLPAFDALGMPYIPSSTLRGVARAQAIREFVAQGYSWKQAERQVAPWFGSLDAEGSDRSGKVIFLDAYPLPQKDANHGGLSVDMANNIWSWDAAGQELNYSPNPNPFFSLEKPIFLIGIRPTPGCDPKTLRRVQNWLSEGLQQGIGSQINTGYGSLRRAGKAGSTPRFFEVEFTLEGQLIHGRQKFTQWAWNERRHEWQMRGQPRAEVRPTAFKSMLRYWFRALALGVLPTRQVKELEAQLFGSISPQKRGWLTVQITEGQVIHLEARPNHAGKQDPCGEQSGQLILAYSSEAPAEQQQTIAQLFQPLTWLIFHLGGIGQGARRPCYSRQTRERAPWWRGSTLIPEAQDSFWELPESVQEFQQLFRQRLHSFYTALQQIANRPLNPNAPLTLGPVNRDRWAEAVDGNCQILVCAGPEDFDKPYALAVLHSQDLKDCDRSDKPGYDPNLCGTTNRPVKPSPVWIANLGDYQVVTVFGATQDPRKHYLQELKQRAGRQNFAQIWPLS